MRACIHRGAREVGGSCFEVQAASGDRLILDLGLPLKSAPGADISIPETLRLDDDAGRLLGVFISHGHPDHFGLVPSLPPGTPVFMGVATERILKEASFFTPADRLDALAEALVDRAPIQIGPFEVTPLLIDHSAYDSYALLVRADGRTLLYSGDLRAHGRKASTFNRLVERPPSPVDVLVLEGTTVGRAAQIGSPETEQVVEERCVELFGETEGMALACFSPQNVDRLVSVYKAALRSGRSLVLDLYAASITAATGGSSIPQAEWDRVRVYVPQAQRVRVKRTSEFSRIDAIGKARIHTDELSENPSRWVMSFRASMMGELDRAGCLAGARALWMMWPGYLRGESGEGTRRAFEEAGVELSVVHASGHAAIEDLQRFASAIDAERVVPVHTDAPERFASLFDHVKRYADGEWWGV